MLKYKCAESAQIGNSMRSFICAYDSRGDEPNTVPARLFGEYREGRPALQNGCAASLPQGGRQINTI